MKQMALRDERGQGLILASIMMVVILASTAMAIDVGYAYVNRRDAQNAADAAALAAAGILAQGGTVASALSTGQQFAELNGYNPDGDTTVTVNIPPASGPHASQNGYAEVLIGDAVSTYFASVVGQTLWHVSARAVAGITQSDIDYGIIALNPTVCKALEMNGNDIINITGGGVFVNSSCPSEALYVAGGGATLTTVGNHVVGGWSIGDGSTVTPAPEHRPSMTDPLAAVPVPTPPSGPVQSCPSFQGPAGTRTLSPGVYNCTINPPGKWKVVFQPGNYLITGGLTDNQDNEFTFGAGVYTLRGQGLKIMGNGSFTANNAMFYIDGGNLDMSGNASFSMTAPASGVYQDIMIFQRRTLTNQLTISGNAAAGGTGTIYAPAAHMVCNGRSSAASAIKLVVDTLTMGGNARIDITMSGSSGATGAPHLVE